MNQTELVQQIRAFLADKDDVTAPGLVLLSNALTALERDTPAPLAVTLPAWASIAKDFMYGTLAELGLLPEREDEPAPNLQLALEAEPRLAESALNTIVELSALPDNSARFINAVRAMLEAHPDEPLEQVYGRLEGKAQYLADLQTGIADRDQKLTSAEAILSRSLEAAGFDWQDIDDLPEHIKQLRAAYDSNDNEHSPWVQEGKRIRSLLELPNATTDQLLAAITGRSGDDESDVVDPAVHLVHERWIDDAVDLAHAVAGNLSAENRVMAKAAKYIIKTAPREA